MQDLEAIREMASKVEELRRIGGSLYDSSEKFPAVNRNAKRILAAIEMLRLNLEE